MPPQRILLVDGHSVIFAWPQLTALHRQRTERARNALVKLLTTYQDMTDFQVAVVFDGKGARTQKLPTDAEGIQIFYSESNKTADSIIERLVAKYAKQYQILVATDDHLEQQTVLSLGAEFMSTQQLQVELEYAERDFAQILDRLRTQ